MLWVATTFLISGSAQAVIKNWAIYGEVLYNAAPGLDPNIVVGSDFRLYLTIDDQAVDQDLADLKHGYYITPNTTLTVEFRHPVLPGLSAETVASLPVHLDVYNDVQDGPSAYHDDYFLAWGGGFVLDFGADPPGYTILNLLLQSSGSTTPVSGNAGDLLESPPPLLSGFTDHNGVRMEMGGFGEIEIGVWRFGDLGSFAAPYLPIQKDNLPGGSVKWTFASGATSGWYDPPITTGYVYETDGNSLFTAIEDFPPGFNQKFQVETGGSILGTYGPGESVVFDGGGVQEFTIRGIDPGVDAADQLAFALKIGTSSASAIFSMTSIVETPVPALSPSATALVIVAMTISFVVLARRRRLHS